LIVLAFPKATGVQRDGDDGVNGRHIGKGMMQEIGKGIRQGDLFLILEQPNGVLKRGNIRVQRPRAGEIGRPASAAAAAVLWAVLQRDG
jgi:hypothetical protein